MSLFSKDEVEVKECAVVTHFAGDGNFEDITTEDKSVLERVFTHLQRHTPTHLEIRTKGIHFIYEYKPRG